LVDVVRQVGSRFGFKACRTSRAAERTAPAQSCERDQHKDLQYAFGHNKALAQSKRVLAYSNERKERYPRSPGLALATQDGDVTLGRRAEQTTVFATEL